MTDDLFVVPRERRQLKIVWTIGDGKEYPTKEEAEYAARGSYLFSLSHRADKVAGDASRLGVDCAQASGTDAGEKVSAAARLLWEACHALRREGEQVAGGPEVIRYAPVGTAVPSEVTADGPSGD